MVAWRVFVRHDASIVACRVCVWHDALMVAFRVCVGMMLQWLLVYCWQQRNTLLVLKIDIKLGFTFKPPTANRTGIEHYGN